MTKNSPNKKKSLALLGALTTPNKIQKAAGTPKLNKSPKGANKTTPQKKQMNGKQGTPKDKKFVKAEDDEDLEENESEESMEQEELNGNSDSDEDVADSNDDDEEETKPGKEKQVKDHSAERKYSVFVGGLNFQTNEDDLKAYFNKDSILSINLMKKPGTQLSKGSAFINFKDENSVKKALLKNGTELQSRTIKVSIPTGPNPNKVMDFKKKLLASLKRKVASLEKEISTGVKGGKVEKNKKGKFNPKKGGKKPQKA